MASEVEICNLALTELGISQLMSSIFPSDGSVQANLCAIHYPIARDQALTEIGPRWATYRKVLALVGENLVSNWAYAYRYPSDCLNIHSLVIPGCRLPRRGQVIPYEVAGHDGGQVILCDQPDMELIYTARVVNTGLYDSQTVFAIANLLGSRIAMPLSHGDLANALLQGYYALAAQASAKSQNEADSGEPPMSDLEAARS